MKLRTGAFLLAALTTLVGAALWTSGCELGHASARKSYKLSGYWTGAGIPAGGFDRPFGVAVAPNGDVYVTDARDRVVKLDPEGRFESQWSHAGNGSGQFSKPVGIAVAPDGSVYVSDYDQDRVQKFNADGKFVFQFGSHGDRPGEFRAPSGLAIGRGGNVYVADFYNSRVQEFTPDGKLIRVFGHPGRMGGGALHYPTGVAALGGGEILVADAYNYELQWFAEDGRDLRRAGYHLFWLWPRPAEGATGFDAPTGVAGGPNGFIHVADSANHRIVMLSAEGKFLAQWEIPNPNPRIYSPEQIAVSPDGKTVYATDLGGNQVIVLSVRG